MTWDQANAEYQATTAAFPLSLPAGSTFPSNVFELAGGAKASYQVGWGAMQAYWFADCAWQRVALAAKDSDPATASAALDQDDALHAAPVFQSHYDDPAGNWAGVVAKARLGDWSIFQQFYESDCSSVWFQGKTS